MTHSYPVTFFVGGGMRVVASCILFFIPLLQEPIHQKKRHVLETNQDP